MPASNLLAYVHASAELLKLPLGEGQAERVAVHLARTASLAEMLDAFALDADQEPAEIYCPAPFQAAPDGAVQP